MENILPISNDRKILDNSINHLDNDKLTKFPLKTTSNNNKHCSIEHDIIMKENKFLYIMMEDESLWIKSLIKDCDINTTNYFDVLRNGVILCRLANIIQQYAVDSLKDHSTTNNMKDNDMKGRNVKDNDVKNNDMKGSNVKGNHVKDNDKKGNSMKGNSMKGNSMKGNSMKGNNMKDNNAKGYFIKYYDNYKCDKDQSRFFSRENVHKFLQWCRSHDIPQSALFESNDCVESNRDGRRNIVICLMNLARIFYHIYHIPPPSIVQVEQDLLDEDQHTADEPSIPTVKMAPLTNEVQSIIDDFDVIGNEIIVTEGKFHINGKYFLIRKVNDHLIVRIGGGWEPFEIFLEKKFKKKSKLSNIVDNIIHDSSSIDIVDGLNKTVVSLIYSNHNDPSIECYSDDMKNKILTQTKKSINNFLRTTNTTNKIIDSPKNDNNKSTTPSSSSSSKNTKHNVENECIHNKLDTNTINNEYSTNNHNQIDNNLTSPYPTITTNKFKNDDSYTNNQSINYPTFVDNTVPMATYPQEMDLTNKSIVNESNPSLTKSIKNKSKIPYLTNLKDITQKGSNLFDRSRLEKKIKKGKNKLDKFINIDRLGRLWSPTTTTTTTTTQMYSYEDPNQNNTVELYEYSSFPQRINPTSTNINYNEHYRGSSPLTAAYKEYPINIQSPTKNYGNNPTTDEIASTEIISNINRLGNIPIPSFDFKIIQSRTTPQSTTLENEKSKIIANNDKYEIADNKPYKDGTSININAQIQLSSNIPIATRSNDKPTNKDVDSYQPIKESYK